MAQLRNLVRSVDWVIVVAVAVLSVIGILFIYSSGVSSEGDLVSREFQKQIVWVCLGLILLVSLVLADPKRLPEYTPVIYAAALGLLVYTRLFGRVVNGARSWIGLGELGIQPSEFMKIAAMLFLARYLDISRRDPEPIKRFAYSLAIMLVPMGLILSQPDFGTALVFLPAYLAMAFIGGVEKRYLAFISLAGAIAVVLTVLPLWQRLMAKESFVFLRVFYEKPYVYFVLALATVTLVLSLLGFRAFKKRYYYWITYISLLVATGIAASLIGQKILKDYQVMRLVVFLDPSVDPLGSGWNILQSITAIGSGGFTGKGFLQGTQSHYRYLPQQSTDFIFSIISEELGFVGGLIVFSLFLLILVRLALSMKSLRSVYQRAFVAGMFGMILFHFLINAGMAMGIMPITGIPLLFLSYGGSSLWAACTGLGLCLGIGARRFE